MSRFTGIFAAFVILLGAIHSPAAAQDKSLTVFAAASMKNALDEIDAAYTTKTGTKIVVSYGPSSGLAKQLKENLTGEDVREGLTAVISAKLTDPQFEGQTAWQTPLVTIAERYRKMRQAPRTDARGETIRPVACMNCGTVCAGVFEPRPGDWGRRRLPVQLRSLRN